MERLVTLARLIGDKNLEDRLAMKLFVDITRIAIPGRLYSTDFLSLMSLMGGDTEWKSSPLLQYGSKIKAEVRDSNWYKVLETQVELAMLNTSVWEGGKFSQDYLEKYSQLFFGRLPKLVDEYLIDEVNICVTTCSYTIWRPLELIMEEVTLAECKGEVRDYVEVGTTDLEYRWYSKSSKTFYIVSRGETYDMYRAIIS